jgi:transposase-like protein
MPRAGPRKVQRYSLEFKRRAVALSQLPEVEVQAVAEALEIHPFMLSRWRKQARDGTHAVLQEEHALLKKTHPVHLRTKAAIFAFIGQNAKDSV